MKPKAIPKGSMRRFNLICKIDALYQIGKLTTKTAAKRTKDNDFKLGTTAEKVIYQDSRSSWLNSVSKVASLKR